MNAPQRFTADQAAQAATLKERRLLGQVLADSVGLSNDQVNEVVNYQAEHKLRFGEAAVALKLARPQQVLRALALQFGYAYVPNHLELDRELVAAFDPFCAQSERIRELRAALVTGVMGGRNARTSALAVMSMDTGDGRTYLAANLAISLSQLGARTLLIDSNLRRPRIAPLFRLKPSLGLTEILAGQLVTEAIQTVNSIDNLYVLPSGAVPPNPQELVHSPAFAHLLTQSVERFDYVVLDTPAVAEGADCKILALQAGAFLLVARRGVTKSPKLQELHRQLTESGVACGGIILNDATRLA